MLAFRFTLELAFDAPLRYDTLSGHRGFAHLTGGSIAGPALQASFLPDGGDFELLRPDGLVELDGRYVARSDDGIVLYLQSRGVLRADGSVRCSPRVEAPPGRLGWLSGAVLAGVGEREDGGGRIHRIRCFELV